MSEPKLSIREFPSLRILTINPSIISRSTITELLLHLNAPFLDSLTVQFSGGGERIFALEDALLSCAEPLYPVLRSLFLYGADLTWLAAMTITTKILSVVHISLNGCLGLGFFLRRLLPDDWEEHADDRLSRETEYYGTQPHIDNGNHPFSTAGNVRWPLLKTISLSSADTSVIKGLCEIVMDRISRGIPLSTIIFTPLAHNTISQTRLEWLQSKVCVQIQMPA